jgi:NADH-quinone oxidoreductase subunit F
MEKLKSINQFKVLRGRIEADFNRDKPALVIPNGTCGQASGANDLIRIAKKLILERELTELVDLRITGCHGFCELEPSVLVEPAGVFYPKVTLPAMERIVEAVAQGDMLDDLLFTHPVTGAKVRLQKDIPFFASQTRTIMSRNEKVDPIRIFDYIQNGGYSAFTDVLESGDPKKVIEEIKASGLRGRGGAGFPTGIKWERLALQQCDRGKYLICNADEGDPGAYMDRSVLEGNPHSIIEGMLIGAFATGAAEGILYVRNEYPMAIKHLLIALNQARGLALMGDNILGTGFCFDIRLVKGAGAFVCGEETALIASIEGRIGEPRQRPPYPIQRGLNGCPTLINNLETWANIPLILLRGAEAFSKTGTAGSKGTKIFSLVGKVKYTGLVEVPMGITIGKIVHDIGGGPVGKARIKAVQTGGPSGGCIPAERFDLPIDYDSLAAAGSIMGSGGMIVMDENTCMVDVAKYFMNFLKEESCGKCFTCRKGTQRMYEILDEISKGRGTLEHLQLLEELALAVKDTTLCGLGQTAANPVLSTLRYFRREYERHILDKQCDAFVCAELVGAACQAACPLHTEAWRYVALLEKGKYEESYQVIRQSNPFPSICARVCDHKCEQHCQLGTGGGEAVAIRALKRHITDRVDPAIYQPSRLRRTGGAAVPVAVVGGGPAGLSAAHDLSLQGYRVTLFEAQEVLGGMLVSGIPAFRLPRHLVDKEIASLLNDHIAVRFGTVLGRDATIDGLLADGFRAIFLAQGAHKSWPLELAGEDAAGVHASMQFLKSFNLRGEELAGGHVGVIGGGNSALDAARVAFRQKRVQSVRIFYRRTEREMPAYGEEIEAARQEGIQFETLTTPVEIFTKEGRLACIRCVRNRLGDPDASGRRRPLTIPGSDFSVPLDTLIIAIGERPDSECLKAMGLEIHRDGTVKVDEKTLITSREGVFAGGDMVTGSSTVVDAIAAGKKAAAVIDRYLRGEKLSIPPVQTLPRVFLEPVIAGDEELAERKRAEQPQIPLERRKKSFAEVELTLPEDQAVAEARRCLRCDLRFTHSANGENVARVGREGKSA